MSPNVARLERQPESAILRCTNDQNPRLTGVELYFQDLEAAKHFYRETIGLRVGDDRPDHHVRFDLGPAFICLERKGVEDYPSAGKAVVFIEVADLAATLGRIDTFLSCCSS